MRNELAQRILPVVLANITTPYPYHDAHLTQRGEIPRDPTEVHPAFGNSFDWHSSVHSHWTAIQLLDYMTTPGSAAPDDARALQAAVIKNLGAANIAAEAAYLAAHRSYERPYGWAWALMLAVALKNAADAEIRRLAPNVFDLVEWIAGATLSWLQTLSEPVRHGLHANTAFALGLMFDASVSLELDDMRTAIQTRAATWFEADRQWPEQWERSGTDFLSAGLVEADLMRRLLAPDRFRAWWNEFLPAGSTASRILGIVDVPDVSDGQIVHLHGLNLSRAGALARIALALDDATLLRRAVKLYHASKERAIGGDYLATHWLPTFAWDAAFAIDRASLPVNG